MHQSEIARNQRGVDAEELRNLINNTGDQRVSIYMPTHTGGAETRQDPIRLKNLLAEAEQHLEAIEAERSTIEEMLALPRTLLDDSEFWRHQRNGLALFITEDDAVCYRMPESYKELVVAGRRFHVTPLITHMFSSTAFHVIVVSQDEVHLLECTPSDWREVEVPGLPDDTEAITKFLDVEKQLQFHTARTGGGPGKAHEGAFHGHGANKDDHKTRISEFFHAMEEPLRKALPSGRTPLVFAGVEYLFPILQQAAKSLPLIEEFVHGNFDQVRADLGDVHRRAAEIITSRRSDDLSRVLDLYGNAASHNKSSTGIREITLAANDGRVEALFVQPNAHCWGKMNEQSNTVHALHDDRRGGDEDLVSIAAARTFLREGRVLEVPADRMPDRKPVAALFRY